MVKSRLTGSLHDVAHVLWCATPRFRVLFYFIQPVLVRTLVCLSSTVPPFAGSSWTGRTGFVQQAIKEDGIRLPRNSGILVCGHPGMAEEVKAYALAAGVLDGRVLSNY